MVDQRYYTVREIQKLLGISEDTVLAEINCGNLVAINVAKQGHRGQRPRWRVAESEVGKWMLRRRNHAACA